MHHQEDQTEVQSSPKNEPQYLFLKVGFKIQKVQINEILFVEGMKDYIRIHTTKEKIMTLLSFAQLAELLPEQKFSRVHRSFVVAVDKIEYIEKNSIRVGDQNIPISESYADAFFKKLNGGR